MTSKCLVFCVGRRMRACGGLRFRWPKCSCFLFPCALQAFHSLTHSPTHSLGTNIIPLESKPATPGKLASSRFSVGSLWGGSEEVFFHVQGEKRLEVVTSTLSLQKHYDGRVDGRVRPYFDTDHSWRTGGNPLPTLQTLFG